MDLVWQYLISRKLNVLDFADLMKKIFLRPAERWVNPDNITRILKIL